MVQESLTEYGDREEEELRKLREAQAATLAPPPAPAGYGMAGSVANTLPAAPGYVPPAPPITEPPPSMTAAGEMAQMNTFGSVLPQARDLQAGLQVAGEFPIPQGQTPYNLTPAGLEDKQASGLREQLLGGAPEPQGYVPTVPTGYTESPLATAAKVAAGPLQVYDALNVDIPYVTPALQAASPYISQGVDMAFPVSQALDAVGLPTPGQQVIDNTIGQGGALDIALLLAPGGVGYGDDIARMARQYGPVAKGYADNVVRGAFPEPTLNPGYGANMGGGYDYLRYVKENAPAAPDPRFPLPVDPLDPIANAKGFAPPPVPDAPVPHPASMYGYGSRGGGVVGPTPLDIQRAAEREALAARQAADLPPDFVNPFAPADEALAGQGQVIRIAVAPDAIRPLDPNSLVGSTGGVELIDPTRARVLGPGEAPGPGEVLMNHGTGNAGLTGDLRPGMNLTPNPEQAQSFARTAARMETLTGGGSTPVLPVPESVAGPVAATPPPAIVIVPDGRTLSARRVEPDGSVWVDDPTASGGTWNIPAGRWSDASAPPPPAAGGFPPGRGPIPPGAGATPPPPPPGAAGGFPPGQGPRPPGAGPTPPASATPAGTDRGWYGELMDTLYTIFGGEIGTILRQDVTSFLNVFKVPETIRVIRDAGTMFGGKVEAKAKIDELLKSAATRSARIDPKFKPNLQLPDIPGVTDSRGFLTRDTGGPGLLGKIPVVNAPVNATARANAAVLFSRRIHEYNKFVDNLPPKAFLPENIKHTKAAAQHFADMRAVVGGRGSLGPRDVENFLQNAGGLFTSLRYMVSMPQRLPYLVPVQRLAKGEWDFFGPAWRNAVQEHVGFAATLAPILIAANEAGLEVSPEGLIKQGDTWHDITGGAASWYKMIKEVADGNTMAGVNFVRNRVGPLPQTVIQAIEAPRGDAPEQMLGRGLEALGMGDVDDVKSALNFLRPEFFNQGATGSGTDADRAAAFGVFLFIQDAARAYRNTQGDSEDKLKAAGIALGAGFIGASSRTYPPYPLTALREQYQNDPRQDPRNVGVPYDQLGSDGQKARDAIIQQDKPDEYKEAIKQRDESGLGNPAFATHKERNIAIDKQEDERKTQIYEALRSGKITPEQAREGRALMASAANAARDAARNDPAFKKAVSELEKNPVNTYLDAYYQIPERLKGPDGKPDWDAVRAKQEEFLKFVEGKDAAVGGRLRFEVETKKGATNMLDALYVQAQPLLQKYFGDIKDDYARATAQKNNPKDDAFLALLGYGKTQSTEAAAILQQMRATLPATNAPVAAGAAQRSVAPAPAPAPPQMQPVGAIGPDGRTVAQITGTPYLSDAERNWYFQSRGLPVPQAGGAAAPRASGGGPSPSATRTGTLPAPTGATLPPIDRNEFLPNGQLKPGLAGPQQQANFVNAVAERAHAYAAATGIPAAVWVAMGGSESNYGRAPSIFGIKGLAPGGGSANLATHEVYGGKNVNINDQFAAYNTLDDAFLHFIDLTSKGRYAGAHQTLQSGDVYGFLRDIVNAGYATDKNWHNMIWSSAADLERRFPQLSGR